MDQTDLTFPSTLRWFRLVYRCLFWQNFKDVRFVFEKQSLLDTELEMIAAILYQNRSEFHFPSSRGGKLHNYLETE